MMRKKRRLAVALAVSSLVAGGMFFGVSQLAHAQDVAGTCSSSGADANCNVTETITSPSSILVSLSTTINNQYPTYNYTLECSLGSQSDTTTGSGDAQAPYTQTISLPYTNPDSCTISVTAIIPTGDAFDHITLTVEYTTGTSTSSSGPVSVISGYDNKCLDDRGNSSANKTEVIIWTCNNEDSAQGWTFTNGELQHNGKCANDPGYGGSGTKLILWNCTGTSNEKWSHTSSDGEYILSSSSHGLLCLNDPGYSKTNRTQLIVYRCTNSSNEHWS
jgi:Ricin-type beta-trefoil lectin domain